MYEVMLDGTEFIITVRAERLTQFETESETESKRVNINALSSKPTKTATNKEFVEIQSNDIPSRKQKRSKQNIL